MRTIVILLMLGLSGCVSQNTMLTNSAGRIVQCKNWGFGIIGAPIAMVQQSECIKEAKAAGYTMQPKQ